MEEMWSSQRNIRCNRTNESGWGLYTANSHHPGGVNVLLMDASVHFVTETVDCGDMNAVYHPNNYLTTESPYGVWGAKGTMDAGEAKRL